MARTADSISFTNANGHALSGRLHEAAGVRRGVALFAHCFTCSKDLRAARRVAACAVATSVAGQSSLSIRAARSGRQCARNRVTKAQASSGANWWRAVGGISGATIRAEVSVPVVSRNCSPGRAAPMRAISASAASASPTLAPCSHTSGPSGRGRPGRPMRSPSRALSSLPRAARRASKSRASGAASREAAR